jgi:hypothetical protein
MINAKIEMEEDGNKNFSPFTSLLNTVLNSVLEWASTAANKKFLRILGTNHGP